MKNNQCIACGMPMSKPEDHAGGDMSRDYCVHCSRPDGTMVTRDEARAGLTGFMVKTRGIDEDAAHIAVEELIAGLPAWTGE